MFFKQQNAGRGQAMTAASELAPSTRPTPSGPAPTPTAPANEATAVSAESGKRLIVGEGIRLKGEITACDLLVVEGTVEVTLNDTRALEIKQSGKFNGSCEVDEARICGVYEGDLTVRDRLTVQTGGRVAGKICYGEIELERGGQLAGELSTCPRGDSQASVQRKGGRDCQAA